jgi:hypothetical protein
MPRLPLRERVVLFITVTALWLTIGIARLFNILAMQLL